LLVDDGVPNRSGTVRYRQRLGPEVVFAADELG